MCRRFDSVPVHIHKQQRRVPVLFLFLGDVLALSRRQVNHGFVRLNRQATSANHVLPVAYVHSRTNFFARFLAFRFRCLYNSNARFVF